MVTDELDDSVCDVVILFDFSTVCVLLEDKVELLLLDCSAVTVRLGDVDREVVVVVENDEERDQEGPLDGERLIVSLVGVKT